MVLKTPVQAASPCIPQDMRADAGRTDDRLKWPDGATRWLSLRTVGARLALIVLVSLTLWAGILLGLHALLG